MNMDLYICNSDLRDSETVLIYFLGYLGYIPCISDLVAIHLLLSLLLFFLIFGFDFYLPLQPSPT